MGFFDDLSKKASQTYKNTTEKTSKITREMKLKSLINEDKGNIEKIYAEIGKKVYEKHIREENIDIKSELFDECTKIDAYAKEIEDMKTEVLALKDLRLCKVCATEISINSKFCPKCGAVQSENIKTEKEEEQQNFVEQVTNCEETQNNNGDTLNIQQEETIKENTNVGYEFSNEQNNN